MRVRIDAERCEGHGRCYDLCPEVFDLDDSGHARVDAGTVAVELEPRVVRAAANCPEQAIVIEA